ncbi:hypothetical protein DMENIID0001_011850 [Sergentomyia squamirostris]
MWVPVRGVVQWANSGKCRNLSSTSIVARCLVSALLLLHIAATLDVTSAEDGTDQGIRLPRARRTPIYQNEFAVYIPASDDDTVNRVASKHGFTNMGQIGSLKGYYLFHHHRISKRSTTTSDNHHEALNSEPEVSVTSVNIHTPISSSSSYINSTFNEAT